MWDKMVSWPNKAILITCRQTDRQTERYLFDNDFSLFDVSQGLVEQQQQTSEDDSVLPLPMDHVRYTLSTEERRMIYDYVVEVSDSAIVLVD